MATPQELLTFTRKIALGEIQVSGYVSGMSLAQLADLYATYTASQEVLENAGKYPPSHPGGVNNGSTNAGERQCLRC